MFHIHPKLSPFQTLSFWFQLAPLSWTLKSHWALQCSKETFQWYRASLWIFSRACLFDFLQSLQWFQFLPLLSFCAFLKAPLSCLSNQFQTLKPRSFQGFQTSIVFPPQSVCKCPSWAQWYQQPRPHLCPSTTHTLKQTTYTHFHTFYRFLGIRTEGL